MAALTDITVSLPRKNHTNTNTDRSPTVNYLSLYNYNVPLFVNSHRGSGPNFDLVMRGGNEYSVSSSRQGLDPKTRPSRRLPLVVIEKSLRCVVLMKRHAPRLQ